MAIWNTAQINAALGVSLSANISVNGVTTDTRKIKKGDVFIALKGENFDGNKYALEAILNGAELAITDDSNLPENKNILKVENAYQALLKLAEYKRKNSKAKFIGITGSVGKTTVKEALGLVLAKQGKTHVTVGNLNNHIGMPLTLANLPDDTEFAVIEMGMNHADEIRFLTKICQPHIALITYIAAVHIEFFNNVEEIAYAKSEIFEGVQTEGTAILPADSEYYNILKQQAEKNNISKIYNFGKKANDWVLENGIISANINAPNINSDKINQTKINFTPNQTSSHFINNLFGVLTAVQAAGANLQQAANDISEFGPPKGRGKVVNHASGAKIIDDAYNASPESVRAALEYLGTYEGKKIALLGDMRELGVNAPEYHKNLHNAFENIDEAYFYGDNMKLLYDLVKDNLPAKHFTNLDEITPHMQKHLQPNTVILIKGSNGTGLWKIVEMLAG
jgi:UDP-N-acetylmuramoyl-tripeptide--D-alanyl-D-alanine ligase